MNGHRISYRIGYRIALGSLASLLIAHLALGPSAAWAGPIPVTDDKPAKKNDKKTAKPTSTAPKTVTFPSEDKLSITADVYMAHADTAPFVVLFHQAGWSRGEYQTIAPKLNRMGFNCMAIDQRSGNKVNGVSNETVKRAKKARKGTTYVHALPDMRAALAYARSQYAKGTLIAWGSSYSSSLVLQLAGTHPQLADVTLAFAPGEYFRKYGKSKTWIRDAAKNIKKPVFITSAKSEHKAWSAIFEAIQSPHKASYLPKTKGNHGSRALWKKFSDSSGYWDAVTAFLDRHAPR